MISRKVPETSGPIRPVAWCSAEASSSTAPLSAADAEHDEHAEREDDRRVPEEKKKPTPSGRWPSVMSLRVVLSIARDVVGVEGVAQAERVRGDAEPDAEHAARAERVLLGRDDGDQQEEADRVEPDDDRRQPGRASPLGRGERPSGPSQRVRDLGHPPATLRLSQPARNSGPMTR